MKINFDKIRELYGIEVLYEVKDNLENVNMNIIYLNELGIENIEEIVEQYILIFLYDFNDFRNSVNELILKLGKDYNNILSENSDYWSELL